MKKVLIALLVFLLLYSRFVGLDWGLPYPMHPDERNIVLAIDRLTCEIPNANCFNPEFFAYGQPTIYAGYLLSRVPFIEPVMALRIISALASVLNVFVLYKMLTFFMRKVQSKTFEALGYLSILVFTFAPYFVQFSHFGTTESLLMLLYSTILYMSLLLLDKAKVSYRFVGTLFFVCGFAVAVKISSLVFVGVPFLVLWYKLFGEVGTKWVKAKRLIHFSLFGLFVFIVGAAIFSPQSILHWQDFLGSMKYETDVGSGAYRAFYTRQFEYSIPYLFQFVKVFPYALGIPVYVASVLAFMLLPWRNKYLNVLRLGIVLFFLPSAFLYAKWTRFLAPMFPLMTLIAVTGMYMLAERIKFKSAVVLLTTVLLIVNGVAYLRIYQSPDVRFEASDWIATHIPEDAYILSETANVVDIPLVNPKNPDVYPMHRPISFDFYHLNENETLQEDLATHSIVAEYIFVPSRRLFANHTCFLPTGLIANNAGYLPSRCGDLYTTYPELNKYYDDLFLGANDFVKVAEFTSYPRIEIFGYTLLEFPDEHAEETWTVFDHPVIRIYKKVI